MASGDKRSVSTDALETLGTIFEDGGRDAIHLAVEPVVAGETLYPGQHIGTVDGVAWATKLVKKVGIVDPFLTEPVRPEQKFWLVVYPRQITSLRHVWSHPDFPENSGGKTAREASEAWLRDFVSRSDCPSYEEVLGAALSNRDGEYLFFRDQDAHGEIPPEFWEHVESVTGQTIPSDRRASWFSCSC